MKEKCLFKFSTESHPLPSSGRVVSPKAEGKLDCNTDGSSKERQKENWRMEKSVLFHNPYPLFRNTGRH